MGIPDKIGDVATGAEQGYLPLPAAIAHGLVIPDELEPMSPQRAAMLVAQGVMPANAGLVDIPGRAAAFDFTAVRQTEDGVDILPTAKTDVCPDSGLVCAAGVISLVFEDGLVRPTAIVEPQDRSGWALHGMLQRATINPGVRLPRITMTAAGLAIRTIPFDKRADLEATDITEEGGLRTKPRRQIF